MRKGLKEIKSMALKKIAIILDFSRFILMYSVLQVLAKPIRRW
jgi:hypothetical protein